MGTPAQTLTLKVLGPCQKAKDYCPLQTQEGKVSHSFASRVGKTHLEKVSD